MSQAQALIAQQSIEDAEYNLSTLFQGRTDLTPEFTRSCQGAIDGMRALGRHIIGEILGWNRGEGGTDEQAVDALEEFRQQIGVALSEHYLRGNVLLRKNGQGGENLVPSFTIYGASPQKEFTVDALSQEVRIACDGVQRPVTLDTFRETLLEFQGAA